MNLDALLDAMCSREALDLHLAAGQPAAVRVNGALERLKDAVPNTADLEEMVLAHLNPREITRLVDQDDDISKRFRYKDRAFMLHVFHEQGRLAVAIRVLPTRVPTLEDLYETGSVGALLASLMEKPSGLIVVTGHTGSGKMTTLAAMVEQINQSRARRILTLEDPIQYLFESKQSLITQRDIGEDTPSFPDAVRSAFREDVDVVLIGEMYDMETLSLALSLADTGHLVLLPVHCERAASAVERLIDVFPEPRGHMRRLLARTLLAVVAQALLPRSDRPGRVAVNEILLGTPSSRRAIAAGDPDLEARIAEGRAEGMQTMDDGVMELLETGKISMETARGCLSDPGRLAGGSAAPG